MSGGEITGNKIDSDNPNASGGGVFNNTTSNYCTLGGNAVIKENKKGASD